MRCGGSGSGWKKEISIKQGTAESRRKELRLQYPKSASLTKQCALNAKVLQSPPTKLPPPLTVNGWLVQWKGVTAASRKTL